MWETVLFALSLSLDSFAAGAATGAAGIRVPPRSILTASGISSGVLALAILAAGLLADLMAPDTGAMFSGLLLSIMGAWLLLQWAAKRWLQAPHRFQGHVGPLRFVLELCLDETQADMDRSKVLSIKEAAALSLALSLDSVGAGLGWGFKGESWLLVAACCFLFNCLSLSLGHWLGAKLARKDRPHPLDLSWAGGALLLVLGLTRLL